MAVLLEERVETLETILSSFITNTEKALLRLEREMKEFKDEMRAYRERAEEQARARDLELQAFKEEMKAFKDEMLAFKDEMKAFKDEMLAFKDEMLAFKDEMLAFRKEAKEEARQRNREWTNLAKKMGTLVEDLIAPALRPVLKKYFDCEVTMEGQRMFRRIEGNDYEIDAIAACDDKVFMVEVRSTPRLQDVSEFVDKSKRFFDFFPEYKGKRLIIIFGSITFPERVIEEASKSGIYVLAWKEWEYMDILNFDMVKQ
jgi:isopenicillin N synthase-like dioxygenase